MSSQFIAVILFKECDPNSARRSRLKDVVPFSAVIQYCAAKPGRTAMAKRSSSLDSIDERSTP